MNKEPNKSAPKGAAPQKTSPAKKPAQKSPAAKNSFAKPKARAEPAAGRAEKSVNKPKSVLGVKSSKTEKAYKLLAFQENISNNAAKDLIDLGVVFCSGKRVEIARSEMDLKSSFKVLKPEEPTLIFQDDNIFVVNKPAFIDSEKLEERYGFKLLHRLDKETSGVLMLVKNEEFRQKAIGEFKHEKVYKEYICVVDGVLAEPATIDVPLATTKGAFAKSFVSNEGKKATTIVEPIEAVGKKSKIKAVITTGRTHQIRAHLKHIGHPIVGDKVYSNRPSTSRMLLHALRVRIFNYDFFAPEPKELTLAR